MKSISESKKLSLVKTDGARLLYTWLIAHLDINGCFSGDAEVINGMIFTRLKKSVKTVEEYLQDLSNNKLIIRYEVNGDIFLHLLHFKEKQPSLRPEKEKQPTIPPPPPNYLESLVVGNSPGENGGILGLPAQDKIREDKISIREVKDNTLVEQAQRIFNYWKISMKKHKAQYLPIRSKKIIARLKEGYTEAQCCRAIGNISRSAFHRGENKDGREYISIELIFRNGEKLEEYINLDATLKNGGKRYGARE